MREGALVTEPPTAVYQVHIVDGHVQLLGNLFAHRRDLAVCENNELHVLLVDGTDGEADMAWVQDLEGPALKLLLRLRVKFCLDVKGRERASLRHWGTAAQADD